MKNSILIRKLTWILSLLFILGSWNMVWGQYNSIEAAKQAAIDELTTTFDSGTIWELINDYRTNKNNGLPTNQELETIFSISTTEIPNSTVETVGGEKKNGYFYTTITYRQGGAGNWPDNVTDATAAAGIALQGQTNIAGNASKDIYVQTGQSRLIRLQDSGAENLDGFIHWYFVDETKNAMIAWNGTINTGEAFLFKNGWAWLRGTSSTSLTLKIKHQYTYTQRGRTYSLTGSWTAYDNDYFGYNYSSSSNDDNGAPDAACAVLFTAPSQTGTYQLYCDASAVNNATQGDANTVITPKVAVQTVYNIHVVDGSRLKTESPFSGNNLDLGKTANFLESYEIHTPNNGTTNFRLNEPLANYLVPNSLAVPTQVRWRQYDASGNYISDTEDTTDGNIVSYTFTETDAKQIYIMAEVSADGSTWYPVSLLKVYLEPNAEPLTQSELNDKTAAGYDQRKEGYLTQHGYEQIAEMTFGTAEGEVTKENNFATQIPEGLQSAYAFADLTEFQHRRANRMNVGRGEYGLYRTLNYPGISTPSDAYTEGDETGKYNDYFATTGGYNNYILDHTGNGYFFYLDATDEPGVITRLKLPELCPNTTLLVSAWICDMAHSLGASHADVGFTIKRKSTDGEEVLTRYYSGAVYNKPGFGTSNQQAEWQQVFFRFTFTGGSSNDEYYVEISSNTPNSNGADYAIDDIRVYKSSPDIRVDRLDACTSSILQITSPYERILTNMGWQENEELDDSKSDDTQYEGYLYFAFFDDDQRWVTVNNKVENPGLERNALKVWISTKKESIPASREAAATKEAALNSNSEAPYIYVPWLGVDGTLHITEQLNVEDTDLKYIGEPIGEGQSASGEYHVILFSQNQASAGMDYLNKTDKCALVSSFKVKGSTTIVIETATDASTALCAGALRKITASLNGYAKNTGEPIDLEQNGIQYIFDWYLGSKATYDSYTTSNNNISIKTMLASIRSALGTGGNPYTGEITADQLMNYTGDYKDAVLTLIHTGKLRTGTQPGEPFSLIVEETEIVALPLVYSTNEDYEYCTEETVVTLPVEESEIPILYPGFDAENAQQLTSAPLRLGLRHLNETISNIPIRKHITVSAEGATLKAENAPIYLNDPENDYPEVGTVLNLYAAGNEGGQFSISLITTNPYVQAFQEGESYELLIPFAQYDSSGDLLSAACDGLATFTIKVVPEYLTWQGHEETDVWYNDAKWKQSTKGELFFNVGEGETDANGTDDVTKAFAPLYFTKITIPENNQTLALEDMKSVNNQPISIPGGANATEHIQYDMAVDTVIGEHTENIQIVPYYINKIDEIYFKPGATLMNQHLLTYNKAWVEFYLKNNEAYWMASPLHATYAGDFYAPLSNGSQDTPAFEAIKYDSKVNSRWGLPFYQKAWNKGVTYSLNTDGSSAADVAAVKSNWSIEYNDVWVPDSIGKGFYIRYGEGETGTPESVKVRLPKADTDYSYESLRSGLSVKPDSRTNYGRLAGTEKNGEGQVTGEVTVKLSDVDGDGTHFLVGNPYMTYLNMAKFLKENESVLAAKYWTLNENNSTEAHVVGTPDVAFDEQAGGYMNGTGTVAPMQAFFVELNSTAEGLAEGNEAITTSRTIKFIPDMMAPTAEGLPATQTSSLRFAAINPMITLTATCGDLRSHATLLATDDANNGYEAAEDAVVLIDSELRAPIAYSVAGSQAVQVNAVKEIRNVGLGVYVEGNREVTLTLSGLDRFATSLSLYDAKTRTSQRLEGDSFSLTVSGSSHGRYFLRSEQSTGTEAIGAQDITIYSAEPGKVIIDALQPIHRIQVFSLNGAQERNWGVNSTHQTLYLPAGIYMIHVSDGTIAQVEKVIVR